VPIGWHEHMALAGAVAVGGSLGTALRYEVSQLLPTAEGAWPVATLLVNLTGAFALGFLLVRLRQQGPDTGRLRTMRLFGGTGFLGGLTTYSSLALETVLLARHHHGLLASAYPTMTVGGGLVATLAGMFLATLPARAQPFLAVDPEPEEMGE
jgi:fluoride exporter